MVFQLQFTLLQTPQLQFVMAGFVQQQMYNRIQVAVFDFKLYDASLNFLRIGHNSCGIKANIGNILFRRIACNNLLP
jgi:hypothetical protein